MSQENVELVSGLPFYAGTVDLAQLRDADSFARWFEVVAPLCHEDFESVFPHMIGDGTTHTGMDGFAAVWFDWLAAWATYRIKLIEATDCGDQVLVYYEILARAKGSDAELKVDGGDVWTIRDGRLARWEGYGNRKHALRAVGLEE